MITFLFPIQFRKKYAKRKRNQIRQKEPPHPLKKKYLKNIKLPVFNQKKNHPATRKKSTVKKQMGEKRKSITTKKSYDKNLPKGNQIWQNKSYGKK